ncbi:MAG: TlpA family protein disulfide reductase [Prevotella sp.]|nr:TlpA family protein disulfide reductase [Prevotella sp.]MDR2005268.1 TlpA family protein disulfide reductase [Prevotella sp.]
MKKNLFLFLLALSCIGSLYSQGFSIVNGIWERGKPEAVKLFSIENGALYEIASANIDSENRFVFAFNPQKEGFYAIALSPTSVQNRYVFYFKPGDRLNLKVTAGSYELTDDNTPENKEMGKWHDFIFPLEDKAVYFQRKNSTYVDFFPLLDEKLDELKSYPVITTPNYLFNRVFEDFKRNDLLSAAINFIQTPRSAHPQGEDFGDYYREINLPALTQNTSILNYPGGVSLVMGSYMTSARIMEQLANDGKKTKYTDIADLLLIEQDAHLIANDTIRGEIGILLARNIKTLSKYTEFKTKYGKIIVTDSQKKRMSDIELSLHKNVAGEEAIDFRFPDVTGKEFALSDFKGKVLYIDVWATWCGPCRKEFPAMKELEKQYHNNKDIVFVGVNVDISKDIQKWKDFLEKEQLPGIQIFAGDKANAELMKPYKISGIPRFILIGKDGKLVMADAPRPSSPEIKAALDSALNK